jgi:hypothetical protein
MLQPGIETVIEREFGNLEKIKDNYEKMVVSMDSIFPSERNGILTPQYHRFPAGMMKR